MLLGLDQWSGQVCHRVKFIFFLATLWQYGFLVKVKEFKFKTKGHTWVRNCQDWLQQLSSDIQNPHCTYFSTWGGCQQISELRVMATVSNGVWYGPCRTATPLWPQRWRRTVDHQSWKWPQSFLQKQCNLIEVPATKSVLIKVEYRPTTFKICSWCESTALNFDNTGISTSLLVLHFPLVTHSRIK